MDFVYWVPHESSNIMPGFKLNSQAVGATNPEETAELHDGKLCYNTVFTQPDSNKSFIGMGIAMIFHFPKWAF
nr:Uncharacterised protein [Streptococcus thermophilus]